MRPERGFTLLEVLVALAVLAIAMVALVEGSARQLRTQSDLETSTLATWVASNAIESLRLAEPWPPVGERSGQARMGTRDWYWRMSISQTEQPRIRRVDVAVGGDPEVVAPVARLSGFVGQP